MNELAKLLPPDTSLSKETAENILEISKSGDWLPRLSVTTGSSKLVSSGQAQVGHVVLITSDTDWQDLGKEADVALVAFRSLALDMSGTPPLSYYDRKAKEFDDVMKRSESSNSNCSYGPQFLVWIPSVAKFATLHLGSKSSRKEGPAALTAMKQEDGSIGIGTVMIVPFFIKTPDFQWWTPTLKPSSTPITVLPDPEKFKAVLDKFNNPPVNNVERAPESASTSRAR